MSNYIVLNPGPSTGRDPDTGEKFLIPHKYEGVVFKILKKEGDNYALEAINTKNQGVRLSVFVTDKLFPNRQVVSDEYASYLENAGEFQEEPEIAELMQSLTDVFPLPEDFFGEFDEDR